MRQAKQGPAHDSVEGCKNELSGLKLKADNVIKLSRFSPPFSAMNAKQPMQVLIKEFEEYVKKVEGLKSAKPSEADEFRRLKDDANRKMLELKKELGQK